MSQQILIETYNPTESNIIAESMDAGQGRKNVFLCGKFLAGEVRNKNGRIYPLSEISRAVVSLTESITAQGGVIGERDHPADRLLPEIKYASHLITEIYLNGNDGYGKLKILPTPHGQIIKTLIENAWRPDVSSRGAGSVNSDGIVENYTIQTIDLVRKASGPGCSPRTVYESIENYNQAPKILTLAEAVREDKSAQKYFTKEILKFIQELSKS